MANRRMFSIGIMNSARFLKMPASSRLLYYDLGMRADDDGIVEAFTILRTTGATEDDLKILVAKEYVQVLNEDLVSYIRDWREHNSLRPDRKVDSLYLDLLLKISPDADLLESKDRSDRQKKSGTDNGTSQGCPMSAEDRLGQSSLGQSSLGKSSSSLDEEVEEEDFLEVLRFSQKSGIDLKEIDIRDFLEIYGILELKKAIKAASASTQVIKKPVAYLLKTLKEQVKESKTVINNHITKEVKPNGNFEGRNNKHDEDLEGWIN